VPEAMKRVDDAAAAEGRDPKQLRRIYNLGDAQPPAEQLADFVTDLGFDSFTFGAGDKHEVERLAHDVIPAVREEVRRRRGD